MAERRPFIYNCPICGEDFQHGLHVYGHYIRRYDMTVCRLCYAANWDGWAPGFERQILAHLAERGLPVPERNAAGWLPRD